jgi:hypothetical protein
LIEKYENACQRPLEGKDQIQQQMEKMSGVCGGGGGGAATISVTLRNRGVDNIHICLACSPSDFDKTNFISAGSSRKVNVPLSGRSALSFLAGRKKKARARQTCSVGAGSSLTVVYREKSRDGKASLSCE